MKGGWVERIVFNNFVWALVQRNYIVPVWRQNIVLPPSSQVLEVGCGRGVGSVILIESFNPARVDAFDLDEKMVKKAQNYVSGEYDGKIRVKLGDVTSIDAKEGAYDAVFDFFMLNHVEDWMKGLSEISRVLKRGGFFAFGEFYGKTMGNPIVKNLITQPHEKRFDRQQWVRALAENRLRLMEDKKDILGSGLVGVARKS